MNPVIIIKHEKPIEVHPNGQIFYPEHISHCGRKHKRVAAKPSIANGYRRILLKKDGKCKSFSVHRLVAECFLNSWNKELCVDHIDGNRINNEYSNLRMVDPVGNSMGHYGKTGEIEYRGVTKKNDARRSKPYHASLTHRGVTYFIGYFPSPEEAALAWNEKAIELGFYPESLNKVDALMDLEEQG